MAGGQSDWETLLNHQRELLKESQLASKYGRLAAAAATAAALAAIIAIFK